MSFAVLVRITPGKFPTSFILTNNTLILFNTTGLDVDKNVYIFCNGTLVVNESATLKLTDIFVGQIVYVNATLCINNTCFKLYAEPSNMSCIFVRNSNYKFYICTVKHREELSVNGTIFNINYVMHEPSLLPVLEVICERCHIECRG